MNKTRSYGNIPKTMRRLESRNARWNAEKSIAVPTAPLTDCYRIKSKDRLNRKGKNLAKAGANRHTSPTPWFPNLFGSVVRE